MRGKSPSLTSETKGHAPTVGRGKIFFSKIFFKGPPAPKILEGLLAVRISPFQFHRVRDTELWERDPPITRGATAPPNLGQILAEIQMAPKY